MLRKLDWKNVYQVKRHSCIKNIMKMWHKIDNFLCFNIIILIHFSRFWTYIVQLNDRFYRIYNNVRIRDGTLQKFWKNRIASGYSKILFVWPSIAPNILYDKGFSTPVSFFNYHFSFASQLLFRTDFYKTLIKNFCKL